MIIKSLKQQKAPNLLFCLFFLLCAGLLPKTGLAQPTPDAYLDVPHRFYSEDSIIELPAVLGADNAAIRQINAEIQAVGQNYAAFSEPADDDSYEWCEVIAYPITTRRYLNILLTAVVYPTYGSNGDLYGWVYDKDSGTLVGLDQALNLTGISFARLEADLRLAESNFTLNQIHNVTFIIDAQGQVQFFIRALFDNPEADPWDGFYRWQNGNVEKEFTHLLDGAALDTLPGGPLAVQQGR